MRSARYETKLNAFRLQMKVETNSPGNGKDHSETEGPKKKRIATQHIIIKESGRAENGAYEIDATVDASHAAEDDRRQKEQKDREDGVEKVSTGITEFPHLLE